MDAQAIRLKKDFAVFDCDGHINDPDVIWTHYVEPDWRERVRAAYWKDSDHAIINGRTEVIGGGKNEWAHRPTYSGITSAGPGINKKILKRLQAMQLNDEQKDYLDHKGSYEPLARIKEMDLMGIDQVMIIPTMIVNHLLYCEDMAAAAAVTRAYNDWAYDYSREAPNRIFAAGMLPFQDPVLGIEEVKRLAKRGFRVGLIRPMDAKGRYPNKLFADFTRGSVSDVGMHNLFKEVEDSGMVLGMHTFPALPVEDQATIAAPGDLILQMCKGTDRIVDSGSLGFILEGVTWLAQVLLSGFLDMYPKMKMAIFESNGTWLVPTLEHCDRLFKLYKNERKLAARRLPSEAFYEQCFIAFEGDEMPVFRQWDRYENVAVWSSDAYHHDGSDAWSAIRAMDQVNVPKEVQAKLLGANARQMYGIEGRIYVSDELEIPRPDWFPKPDEVQAHWKKVAYPRRSATDSSTKKSAAPQSGY